MITMFSGLSAFSLTPMNEHSVDEAAFVRLIERLAVAGVDSIGALGSTGNYAYLTQAQRRRIAQLAVQHAGGIPVMVGIGALRTRDVLALAHDAQQVGVSGVLLAPMSYQRLTEDEVFALFETVSHTLSVPLCVYDNPTTTHFEFSDALHARIAQLPNVASIKIPGVPADPILASARVAGLRALLPEHVTIGVSGDAAAATGLNAGCDVWYSAIAGLFPQTALAITRASQADNAEEVIRLAARLEPLWALFRKQGGSLRVIAAAAEQLQLVNAPSLPLPLKALSGQDRTALGALIEALALH